MKMKHDIIRWSRRLSYPSFNINLLRSEEKIRKITKGRRLGVKQRPFAETDRLFPEEKARGKVPSCKFVPGSGFFSQSRRKTHVLNFFFKQNPSYHHVTITTLSPTKKQQQHECLYLKLNPRRGRKKQPEALEFENRLSFLASGVRLYFPIDFLG